jgi:hypothetical protein
MSIFNYAYGEGDYFQQQERNNRGGFLNLGRRSSFAASRVGAAKSQGYANNFSDRLGLKAGRYVKEAETDTTEYTSGFNEFKMTDAMDDRNKASLIEGAAYSEEAIGFIGDSRSNKPAKSLKDYVQKTNNRKAVLRRAQKSIGLARESYKAKGASITFDDTGYSPLEENKNKFLADFDSQITDRANKYAQEFGHNSFEDMFSGYGADNYSYSLGEVESRVNKRTGKVEEFQTTNRTNEGFGQRDIMDMIMADLTGMSYLDVGALNQWNSDYTEKGAYAGYGQIKITDGFNAEEWVSSLGGATNKRGGTATYGKDYTQEQLMGLRDFYGQSQLEAVQNANQRSEQESLNRKQLFNSARTGDMSMQKGRQKVADQMVGKSEGDIQMKLRELDETFMKNIGAFNTVPKKRKVPSISFVEGRPE